MPLTLAKRIGPDTLGKMELAARRRFAEASLLVDDERLGAIYLFGYSVEMRLKAAYYRVVGLSPASQLAPPNVVWASTPRIVAERQVRKLLNLKPNTQVGHDVYGWAKLLEHARATTVGVLPLSAALKDLMYKHVENISLCWTEVLRYRANWPYDGELEAVRVGATWFKLNYSRLWN